MRDSDSTGEARERARVASTDFLVEAARTVELPYRAAYNLVEKHVVVSSNSLEALSTLNSIWAPFRASLEREASDGPLAIVDFAAVPREEPTQARFGLLRDERLLYATEDTAEIVTYLDWMATSTALLAARHYAIFHSAVLTYGTEGCLLPATSGKGKTTLTAALVLAGFGYLSDEAALVDPASATVHAYPKSLSIKRPLATSHLLGLASSLEVDAGRHEGGVWHLDPDILAPGCRRESTTIRTVIFPYYDPHQPTGLVSCSRSTASLELLRHGVNSLARPPLGIAVTTALVAQAACYRLVVNDIAEAVQMVKHLHTQ